jgi:hypothetical protein
MKVAELIELLQRQDPHERVGIIVYENDGETSYHKEIEGVRWDGSEPRVRVGLDAGFVFGDPMS